MSNSFPSMISNEPPPLEQSDDEDEDSEEFRDFASGLKLDVDPSPMSTPRKDGSVSLPVHNGSITPELVLDSKDSSTNPSPFKTPLKETAAKPPEENNINAASAFTGFTSGGRSIMKTSYIGTLESEPESRTGDAPPEVNSETDSIPEQNVPKVEQVIHDSPLASQVADEDSSGDNVDDFKDFQSVEPPPVLSEPPKTDHVTLESSDEVGLSACTEEVSQDLRTNSPASFAQENTELIPPVVETTSPEDVTSEISNDCPSGGENRSVEEKSACSPEAENTQVLDQELEEADTDEMTPQIPPESTNSESIKEVTPDSEPIEEVAPIDVFKGEEGSDFAYVEDEEDDDFEDFQVSVPVQASPISTQKSQEPVSQSIDAATDDDDDFSNFQANFATGPNPSNDDGFSNDGDDFDDFQAFQTTQSTTTTVSTSDPNVNTGPSTAPSTGIFPSQRSALLQDKFDVLVKNLFALNTNVDEPESSPVFIPIDKKLKEESSEDVWNRVEDFEGSQGLVFKWLNSEAHQRLLDSLKIDTSTVVYSGKWGPVQVPRFAASLVDTPLLPQNITTSAGTETVPDNVRRTSSGGTVQDENKVAHPDDAGVMVNGKAPTVNGRILSREAEQIISQLPDLSFMRAKNLVFPNSSASQVVSSDV